MSGFLKDEDILSDEGITKALERKRAEATEYYDRTGSLPDYWPEGLRVALKTVNRKYDDPVVFAEKGVGYIKGKLEMGYTPSLNGLVVALGFTSRSALNDFVKRNIEFREAHQLLMTLLQMPLEEMLTETGVNTQGIIFRLKNLPDGYLISDDMNAHQRFEWKERKSTEITGADGGPILVNDKTDRPDLAYIEMLKAGARLDRTEKEIIDGEYVEEKEDPEG